MKSLLSLLVTAFSFEVDESTIAGLPAAVRVRLRNEALSACFSAAYLAVDSPADCSVLTEREKRQFGLSLTDCHLEDAGRPRACPLAASLRASTSSDDDDASHTASALDCLATTSAEAFGVFTMFTLHIDALCFFAQSRLHARRAEALAAALNATQSRALEVGTAALAIGDALQATSNATRTTLDTLLSEHTRAMNYSLATAHVISSALDRVANISEAALLLSTSTFLSTRAVVVDIMYALFAIVTMFLTRGRLSNRARVPVLLIIVAACALEHAVDASIASETARVGQHNALGAQGWIIWACGGLWHALRGFASVLVGGTTSIAAAVRTRTLIRVTALILSLSSFIGAYAHAPPSLEQVVLNLRTRFDRIFPDVNVNPASHSETSEDSDWTASASDPDNEAAEESAETSKASRKTRAAISNPCIEWESARNFSQYVQHSAIIARHALDSLYQFTTAPPSGDAAEDDEPLADDWSTTNEEEDEEEEEEEGVSEEAVAGDDT